jgi:hypothetical protein
VDAETHVAGVEAAVVSVSCAVPNEQSGADGTSVVQECADDFLESGEACWRQRSGVVFQRR